MKLMELLIRIRSIFQKEQGGALVIALIVMLALVLLGLSLLLQSNTEYMISLNERDSTTALYNAEAAVQLAKRVIKDNGTASTLTTLFAGPDGNSATTADNGIILVRTPSTTLTSTDQLNDDCATGSTTCETEVSVIVDLDGDKWEAFRIGIDKDDYAATDKSGWDGPRGLVYVRIEDNYDDEPATNAPWIDTDRRIITHVKSRYPIQVDSTGTELSYASKTTLTAQAGLAERELIARFGPSTTQPALVTEGDMNVKGGIDVCGECGAIHADGTLTIEDDDVDVCSDATSYTGDPVMNDGGTAQIGGTNGTGPLIDVPIANPFHDDYVPDDNTFFDTVGDTELSTYPTLNNCNASTDLNISKYFALVGDDGGDGMVYKAYWNSGSNRWDWYLIDDLNDTVDTTLDDCGRVVSGAYKTDSTAVGPGIDDSENAQNKAFYGFSYSDGGGQALTCTGASDASLSGTAENNYVDATLMPSGSPALPSGVLLPGSGPGESPTAIADFDASVVYNNNERKWSINASDVYSSVYNAVIFVWGNLEVTGGPSNLCHSGDLPPTCAGANTIPNNVWRVTFIVTNNIDIGGTPAYGPARSYAASSYPWLLVAGRDVELQGNSGGSSICPSACDDPPATLAGFSGIILVHEQLSITGSVSVNGIIKTESAADCARMVQGEGIQGSGSAEVYYDCVNPPDTSSESVRLDSWEEVQ